MRLLLLKVIYINYIITSFKLEKLIRKHTAYVFHIYDTIRKEFVEIYYSKELNKFVVEIDNVIVNNINLDLSCKIQIQNIWNLEN